MHRVSSPVWARPAHEARWDLAVYGAFVLGQGLAKAVDPVGYMAALDAFHVLAPAALGPLSLGALGLVWTVLELLAGVAIAYGGLARSPAKGVTLAGLAVALGLSFTSLALDAGALARHLPIRNTLAFGAYLAQPLSWFVIAQQVALVLLLSWLVARVRSWPVSSRIPSAPSGARRSRRGLQRPRSRTFAPAASRG